LYSQIDWDAVWLTWIAVMAWSLTLAYEYAIARLDPVNPIIDMILTPDGPAFQF
jgi:hypothetical protein